MKNTLRLNHNNKTIVMDRTFAKKSLDPRSDEYELLQRVRTDYPKYDVITRTIKKNPNKECYNGLTYAFMEDYIRTHESKETVFNVLNDFEEMKLISKCHSAAFRYPVIKKWFLDKYPEIKNYGMPSESTIKTTNNIIASSTIEKKDCKDAAVASNPAA